ncbi:hypothetical protein [Thermoactinospora rubra]|uniref:hypothetical protein n=1 Tax=Thermoactinospora rubra TaxID=1088767 RepID=UPI0011807AB5|nr:hypothetical protein [Thermoactinospora rubra]
MPYIAGSEDALKIGAERINVLRDDKVKLELSLSGAAAGGDWPAEVVSVVIGIFVLHIRAQVDLPLKRRCAGCGRGNEPWRC